MRAWLLLVLVVGVTHGSLLLRAASKAVPPLSRGTAMAMVPRVGGRALVASSSTLPLRSRPFQARGLTQVASSAISPFAPSTLQWTTTLPKSMLESLTDPAMESVLEAQLTEVESGSKDYPTLTDRLASKTSTGVLTRGYGRIGVGTILEGTVAYGGILPDILIDQESSDRFDELWDSLGGDDIEDVDEQLDCVNWVVRLLYPKQHPAEMTSFCGSPEVKAFVTSKTSIPLSEFMKFGVGDCRVSSMTQSLGLRKIEALGKISDIEYVNRKWGTAQSATGAPREEVGHQGDHALCTFKYKGETNRYSADAFAVEYDRVLLDGPNGVLTKGGWYNAVHSRRNGRMHNVYAQMVESGVYDQLSKHMTSLSKSRFLSQAHKLDEDMNTFGYQSRVLPYPTVFSQETPSNLRVV